MEIRSIGKEVTVRVHRLADQRLRPWYQEVVATAFGASNRRPETPQRPGVTDAFKRRHPYGTGFTGKVIQLVAIRLRLAPTAKARW